jgi:S-DNA-T family DNA segregation ATPase FtsK/SpoIIIE
VGRESILLKFVVTTGYLIVKLFHWPKPDKEARVREREPKTGPEPVVKEYELPEDTEEGETGEEKIETEPAVVEPEIIAGEPERGFIWRRTNAQVNFPLSLLKNKPARPTSGNIGKNQEIIKNTLADFDIPVTMGEVRVGPTVTQYTFKQAGGIPVSRIRPLESDLAQALSLHPVRIEAPIPNKPLVGLEVPNKHKVLVSLKEVLGSKEFKNRKSSTLFALGRDIGGRVWFDDLASLPHLLVAGATNSGKSVCLNSIIVSLLYQNNPDDLKLLLIDPKQVELTPYNGLPYLLTPVITDNRRAVNALRWCINEMDRRLELLSQSGHNTVYSYNRQRRRLPLIVVVIDELGDLFATVGREAEAAIIRLGQKSRAAGIHLVLATQRPTVDIISGLIKANMPGRVAFSVTSRSNSLTILEHLGAEKLLGKGDMLYLNAQMAKPIRIQGAYIGKDEVRQVVKYAKKQAGKAQYIEALAQKQSSIFDDSLDVEDDLLEAAKELILDTRRASATMLQSRLAIGYPRANRILEILQQQGVVGPSIQNKPREVLVGRED